MDSFNRLRGKKITIAGNNSVNDVRGLMPDLFSPVDWIVEEFSLEFPSPVDVSVTSYDGVDTDYKTFPANGEFIFSQIVLKNIKIKSAIEQTGYIFTASN